VHIWITLKAIAKIQAVAKAKILWSTALKDTGSEIFYHTFIQD
jgi:hypothetical protein